MLVLTFYSIPTPETTYRWDLFDTAYSALNTRVGDWNWWLDSVLFSAMSTFFTTLDCAMRRESTFLCFLACRRDGSKDTHTVSGENSLVQSIKWPSYFRARNTEIGKFWAVTLFSRVVGGYPLPERQFPSKFIIHPCLLLADKWGGLPLAVQSSILCSLLPLFALLLYISLL